MAKSNKKPVTEAVVEQPTSYKFSIIKAPPGTSYSLYLQDNPRRYTQNSISGDNVTLEIPATMTGHGYVSITTPRVDRITYGTTFIVEFTLDHDIIVNVADEVAKANTPAATSEEPTSAPKASKAKKAAAPAPVPEVAPETPAEAPKEKEKFWDKFK